MEDDHTTVSLTTVQDHHTSGEALDFDKNHPTGHVLTIEHPGRDPERDTLGNYIDIIYNVLGEPAGFDDRYAIVIDSNRTVIRRNDVPISVFGSKTQMQDKATSPRLTHDQRRLFESAVERMDATVSDLAEHADTSETFVRRTLALIDE